LSRVGVWGGVLTEQQHSDLFNSGNGKSYADLTTAEKVGLVSYWNLDEVSGNRADSHGSNTLTDNNTVTSVINAGGAMRNVATSFVAANSESLSVADAANDFSIPATGGTLAFWFNPTALSGLRYLGGKTDAASLDEHQIYTNGANLTFQVKLSGGGYSIPVKAATVGVFQLAVLWYDPAVNKCFVQIDDGTPGEAAAASAPTADLGHAFEIGRITASANNFDGLIDEYGFWSRVLTAQERTDLFNGGAGLFYGS
jgi:hypothetical protein